VNSIEAIRKRYLEFLKWDDKSVDLKIIQIAGEYAYYQSLYYETSKKMTLAQKDHDDLWQGKYKQYKYEFDISLNHSEIKTFLDKDNELLAKLVEVKKLRDFANFLEEAMKNINQLRWDIKNYIEWKHFQKGM
jgi:hypothetical protein